MNKETNLQSIYREKALDRIRELCFALEVAEQDNLNDIVHHLVKVQHLASNLSEDLAVLNVLKCHRL
jgi:hypothetical protein